MSVKSFVGFEISLTVQTYIYVNAPTNEKKISCPMIDTSNVGAVYAKIIPEKISSALNLD